MVRCESGGEGRTLGQVWPTGSMQEVPKVIGDLVAENSMLKAQLAERDGQLAKYGKLVA